MARILFVLPRFHTNLWFAVRAMRDAGHDLRLLVNVAGGTEDHSHASPVILGRNPSRDAVAREIDSFAPDVAIIRSALTLSRHAAALVRRRGIPALLYNLHPLSERPSLSRRIEQRFKRLPDRRITPVPGPAGQSPDPRAHYLPWPVARLPVPSDPAPRSDGRLALLCVGKMGSPRKNQPALIDTIESAGLADRVHLTLVGTTHGPKDDRQAHIHRVRGATARGWITLAPPVPFAQMAHHHAAADACALLSFDEPLGVSPVESMAYGSVPLISSDAGSAGYLTHGQDGFVIDMTRPDSLVEAIAALTDPARLASMQAAARHTAETELSEARFIARLHAILRGQGVAV